MRTRTPSVPRAAAALAVLLVASVAPAQASSWLPVASMSPPARTLRFSGRVVAGQRFQRAFGDGLRFVLSPLEGGACDGWDIGVVAADSTADFVALATPPFHGVNPRTIEAWHFRNADNTGPNHGEVNAPQEQREFAFFLSRPDYDVAHDALDVMLWPNGRRESEQDSATVQYEGLPQGEGVLVIREMTLDRLGAGQTPCFASMRFDVELRLPRRGAKSRR